MTEPDLVGLFAGPLERLRIPCMVTGTVASVVYGDPRFTRDIDLVLDLGEADVQRLAGAFPDADFDVPPVDVLRREVIRPRVDTSISSTTMRRCERTYASSETPHSTPGASSDESAPRWTRARSGSRHRSTSSSGRSSTIGIRDPTATSGTSS